MLTRSASGVSNTVSRFEKKKVSSLDSKKREVLASSVSGVTYKELRDLGRENLSYQKTRELVF